LIVAAFVGVTPDSLFVIGYGFVGGKFALSALKCVADYRSVRFVVM
jgi:hypothetical protein